MDLFGSVACVVKVNQREYTENKKGFTWVLSHVLASNLKNYNSQISGVMKP